SQFSIRVLTLNTELGHARPEALAALIAEARPDVVALQEQTTDPDPDRIWSEGWHVRRQGELFVASRYPMEIPQGIGRVVPGGHGVAARVELATPAGHLAFFDVHLQTPRQGLLAMIGGRRPHLAGAAALDDQTDLRAVEAERISAWVSQAAGGAMLV